MLQIKCFLPQNATFVLNPLCLALFLGVIQRTIRKHDISVLQKRDPNLLPDSQHERLMWAALWVVLFVRLSCLLQMVLTAVLRTFMALAELALFLIMCSSRKPTNSRDCICPKQTKDSKRRAKPSLQRIPCLVGGPVDCTPVNDSSADTQCVLNDSVFLFSLVLCISLWATRGYWLPLA